MKAEFAIDFPDEKAAANALKTLSSASAPAKKKTAEDELEEECVERASLSLRVAGKQLVASVSAKDFTALRARSTSLMRDLRVIFDVLDEAR